jgi:hypothetical protein
MNDEQTRPAFEQLASDGGKWIGAARRSADGKYCYIHIESQWNVWKAAMRFRDKQEKNTLDKFPAVSDADVSAAAHAYVNGVPGYSGGCNLEQMRAALESYAGRPAADGVALQYDKRSETDDMPPLERIREHHLNMFAYYTDEQCPRSAQRHQQMADALQKHIAANEAARLVGTKYTPSRLHTWTIEQVRMMASTMRVYWDRGEFGFKSAAMLSDYADRLAADEAAVPPLTEYTPGELDRTAPEYIWLVIDEDGDNADRSEAWPGADGVSWCEDSIGGLQIKYIRADKVAST